MWRPNEWVKIIAEIRKKYFDGEYGYEEPDIIAEAGADAMLKALKGIGQYLPNGAVLILPSHSKDIPRPGWLVFIPEENDGNN